MPVKKKSSFAESITALIKGTKDNKYAAAIFIALIVSFRWECSDTHWMLGCSGVHLIEIIGKILAD